MQFIHDETFFSQNKLFDKSPEIMLLVTVMVKKYQILLFAKQFSFMQSVCITGSVL